MYYIYKIQNQVNHKKYIGLTNNIARRRARHFTDLRCHRHDNSFMQKEFDIYGEKNFTFSVQFKGDVSPEEISQKEIQYIAKYDSYYNGYNQNKGGNFGPSNGGSHLTKSDIFNICAALEFCSRPGAILAEMYDITTTTVSRIKHKTNHCQIIEEYDNMPLSERQAIYKIFCDSSNFYEKKVKQTIIQSKRKLTKQQVFMILYNFEKQIYTKKKMAELVGIKSTYTLDCIKKGLTYKDFALEYHQLSNNEKQKIVSLFSNKQKKNH